MKTYNFTISNDPLAMGNTTPQGINDLGQVVGSYLDSKLSAHGFVAPPQAEQTDVQQAHLHNAGFNFV